MPDEPEERAEEGRPDPGERAAVPDVPSSLRRSLEEIADGAAAFDPPTLLHPADGHEPPAMPDKGVRYVLRGEVGRGGMGAILKVFDSDLRRNVAMKVILGRDKQPGSGGDLPPEVVERFLAEAQITGQLEHPGIVPVHELGIDRDGRMYFTMRLVRGQSYADVIQKVREGREGWTTARALGVLLRICETVAYAHTRHVVHRDLKPANVMVGRFGAVYVMDWGAARILSEEDSETGSLPPRAGPSGTFSIIRTDRHEQAADSDSASATQEGSILGTPYYMPYEQASGSIEEIGPHTDVYAIGAILYELMTGRRPYEMTGRRQGVIEIVTSILKGPPKPARELVPDAPQELLAICDKAMAYRWTDRYPDMEAMAIDLRAFLEGRVVEAYDTSLPTRVRKWIARNRPLAATLGGLIVVGFVSLVALTFLQRSKLRAVRTQQALTAEARDQAESLKLAAEESAERAWREGYVASLVAANASLNANEVLEAKRLLDTTRPELRGWEWRHLRLAADASRTVLEGHTGSVLSVDWDSAGERVVSAGRDGTVRVWSVADGASETVLQDDLESVRGALFAADGSVLTFGGWTDSRLRSYDPFSGELVGLMDLATPAVSPPVLSADGRLVALATPAHTIRVIEAATGALLHELDGHEGTVRALAFTPDGGRLLSASEDGTARIWDLGTGSPVAVLPSPEGGLFAIAVDPGGESFVTGAADGTVRSWPLSADGEAAGSRALFRCQDTVLSLAFAPDGAHLAAGSLDRTLRVLDLDRLEPDVLRGHDGPVRYVAFAPDGERLASGGDEGSVRIWDVRRGGAMTVIDGPDEYVRTLAVSPDGSRIALGAHFGGTVAVLDAVTGATIASRPGADDPVNALAFSGLGDQLAIGYEESAEVEIVDAERLVTVHVLAEHESSVTSVAFRSDGAVLASGSTDWTVKLWSPLTGGLLQDLAGPEEEVRALAFEPSGPRLAAAYADGRIVLYDSNTGESLLPLPGGGGGAYALAWSPDGRSLAVGSGDEAVRIWDLAGAGTPRILEGHDQRVSALAFAPDGTRLVSGSFDASLRVWEVASGKPLLSLREHDEPITALAFALDGATLVSASFDNTLRLWRTR